MKAPQAARAVDTQTGDDSALAFYKTAIAFRKASPALSYGTTTFHTLPEPIFAFTRTADSETLTCVFNLSKDDHALTVTGDATLTGPHHARLTGGTLKLSGNGFAYLSHDGAITLST